MSDQEMEEAAPPADSSVGLMTALIVLTSLMLLTAFIATEKMLGDRYNEGLLKSSK